MIRLQPLPVLAAILSAALAGCGDRPAPAAPQPAPGPAIDAPAAAPSPARPASSSAIPIGGAGAACVNPGAGPEPDAAALRAFFRGHASQVRDCYQRALKRDASVGGKASLGFTIGRCGELDEVRVVARTGRVDEPAACVARAMRGWRTPFRPTEPVAVEYPVSFSAR